MLKPPHFIANHICCPFESKNLLSDCKSREAYLRTSPKYMHLPMPVGHNATVFSIDSSPFSESRIMQREVTAASQSRRSRGP